MQTTTFSGQEQGLVASRYGKCEQRPIPTGVLRLTMIGCGVLRQRHSRYTVKALIIFAKRVLVTSSHGISTASERFKMAASCITTPRLLRSKKSRLFSRLCQVLLCHLVQAPPERKTWTLPGPVASGKILSCRGYVERSGSMEIPGGHGNSY